MKASKLQCRIIVPFSRKGPQSSKQNKANRRIVSTGTKIPFSDGLLSSSAKITSKRRACNGSKTCPHWYQYLSETNKEHLHQRIINEGQSRLINLFAPPTEFKVCQLLSKYDKLHLNREIVRGSHLPSIGYFQRGFDATNSFTNTLLKYINFLKPCSISLIHIADAKHKVMCRYQLGHPSLFTLLSTKILKLRHNHMG